MVEPKIAVPKLNLGKLIQQVTVNKSDLCDDTSFGEDTKVNGTTSYEIPQLQKFDSQPVSDKRHKKFMSFIDSQQFSPIQSVESHEPSDVILVTDEVNMFTQEPPKMKNLENLRKLIDF